MLYTRLLYFFLKGSQEDNSRDSKWGFKSRKCPPQVEELKPFEDDILRMVENIEFRRATDRFQEQLRADITRVKRSSEVIVPADKTRNLYTVCKEEYSRLLTNNITKHYKSAPDGTYNEINAEAKRIAEKLDVADRMETMATKDAYITLKDHKEVSAWVLVLFQLIS